MQKEPKANKRCKESNIGETPTIVLGEYKCFFCRVADDVSNLCAVWIQHATPKNINEEKNWVFSDNLWWQASKHQESRVLSFPSLGSTVTEEINYHRLCLTGFYNRYQALVTAKVKEQLFDSYKTGLCFCKIVMHVLDQRRLAANVLRVTELEMIYTELLLEDCMEYIPQATRSAQRNTIQKNDRSLIISHLVTHES